MYKIIGKENIWLLLAIFTGILLSGCQWDETYSNRDLPFTFRHPNYWELVEESTKNVEFLSQGSGSAAISITEADEVVAPTAKESLTIQLNYLLGESTKGITSVDVTEVEHPQYDVAMAHVTYSPHTIFAYDYYLVVIQNISRMVVLRTGGNGTEPAKAMQTLIDSFEFLP